jgi:double-GTPase-like protein
MSDPIKIGLWGPSAAGKTAFLAQLYLQPSEPGAEWRVYPTADSKRFIEAVRPEVEQNRFPQATAVTETISKAAYRFANRKTGEEAELVVEDRAGKEWEQLSAENRKRLNEAQGLIVLFDPGANRRPLRQMIEQTLSQLNVDASRGARRDDRPVAVCLSKADRLIHTPADLRRAVEHPREFVLDRIDPSLLQWVDRFCSDFELFPISAVGVRVRYGVIEPVVFRDESLALRMGSDGKPINLLAPFTWLFDRIGRAGKT